MKYPVNFEIEFRKNNYPGKFIAFEGVDASGKTTYSQKLVENLIKEGIQAVYTKEPTDGSIGKLIRQVLNYEIKVPPISLQYLFCADRAVHQEEIIDYLKKGYVVVSDRCFWSAVAYGISDLGGVTDFYLTAFSVLSFYNQFLSPDFTFYLDIDVDIAAKRIKKSHKHNEIYDRREKIVNVDKSYRRLIKMFPGEFTVIDANKPLDNVSDDLLSKVKTVLTPIKSGLK